MTVRAVRRRDISGRIAVPVCAEPALVDWCVDGDDLGRQDPGGIVRNLRNGGGGERCVDGRHFFGGEGPVIDGGCVLDGLFDGSRTRDRNQMR